VRLLAVPAWDFVVDGRLHFRMALARGIENGFAMVRAAEQGLLTVTDGYGRTIASKTSGAEALLVADVAPGPPALYNAGMPKTRADGANPRLAALSAFTRSLIERRGDVGDAEVAAFRSAGFTEEQVFEVITAVAISAMTNYTANLARPPLEDAVSPHAWQAG